ncbi:uncharacterized protein LOC136025906 [Artemia franciscana]|uniref:uncharacterized protein LOC136025906 n=1 Tax=Artemia franciscana TaxID=6661 RepID=UPI0032DABB37
MNIKKKEFIMNIKKKELNECFAKACEIEAIDGQHKIPINPNDWLVKRHYEETSKTEDMPKLNGKWKTFNYKHFYGDMGRPVDYRCKRTLTFRQEKKPENQHGGSQAGTNVLHILSL